MKQPLLIASMFVAVLMSTILCLGQMNATQAIGIAPYGSYHGGDFDTVDLRSGNLFAHIPLFSLPQLGKVPLSVSLVLNDNGYQNGCFTDSDIYIPQDNDPEDATSPTETTETSQCYFYVYRAGPIGPTITLDQGAYTSNDSYSTYNYGAEEQYISVTTLHDATGASHILGTDKNNSNMLHSIDGTGYTYNSSGKLTQPEGLSYQFPAYPTLLPYGLATSLSDPDGHSISGVLSMGPPDLINNNGFNLALWFGGYGGSQYTDDLYYHAGYTGVYQGATFGDITDSMGRTISSPNDSPLQMVGSGSANILAQCPPNVDGQSLAAAQDWPVPGPNGQTVHYYLCYTQITINTNFSSYQPGDGNGYFSHQSPGSTGAENYFAGDYYADAVGTGLVLQAVRLPNNTYWKFSYDSAGEPVALEGGGLDPLSMPIAFGDVTKITNPFGGSTAYQYYTLASGVGPNVLNCVNTQPQGDNYSYTGRVVQSRTVSGPRMNSATWNYGYESTSSATGAGIRTTISDPTLPSGEAQTRTVHTYQDQSVGQCNLEEILVQRYDGSNLLQSTATTSFNTAPNIYAQIPGVAALAQVLPAVQTTTTGNSTLTTTLSYSNLFTYVPGPYSGGLSYQELPINFAEPTTTSVSTSDGSSRTSVTAFEWQSSSAFLNAGVLDAVSESCVTNGSNGCSSAEAGQGAATEYSYGDSNHPYSITAVSRKLGNSWITTSSTSYDSNGRPSTTSDGDGNATTFGYGTDPATGSPSPFPNTVTNALNQVDRYTYDDNTGNMTWHKDRNQNETTYTFDQTGRPLSIAYPDIGSTTYCYTDLGGSFCTASAAPFTASVRQLVHDTTSATSSSSYDGLGRVWQATAPDNATSTTEYDALGRVYTVSNPHAATQNPTDGSQTFLYDALGRKTIQTQQDGSRLQWCYDGLASSGQTGCLRSSSTAYARVDSVDENGNVRQQFTDGLGRLRQVVEDATATQLTTTYGYNVMGDLLSVYQAGNGGVPRQRSFTYDSLSRLLTAFNPEAGSICYGTLNGSSCSSGYDPAGLLHDKTDARGVNTHFTYDPLNRLTARTFTDGTASDCLSYDTASNGIGYLASQWTQKNGCPAAPGANTLTKNTFPLYDSMGRPKQEQQCILNSCQNMATLNYDYDLAGEVTDVLDNKTPFSGYKTTATFDIPGRIKTVSSAWVDPAHPSVLLGVTSYAPTGAPTNLDIGGSLSMTRTYDNRTRVTSLTVVSK